MSVLLIETDTQSEQKGHLGLGLWVGNYLAPSRMLQSNKLVVPSQDRKWKVRIGGIGLVVYGKCF